jgi:hypothetical protein
MTDEAVAALAEAVGLSLSPDRLSDVAELLETLIRDGGGATPDEVAGIEPAAIFDSTWPS